MEAQQVQEPVDAPAMLKDEASDLGKVAQFGIRTTKAEDINPKAGPPQWQDSPVHTTSLLPPFGMSQPSHLPTPQSPGNVASYLNDPSGSPFSLDHMRAGPSHHFPTPHPSALSESAQPPKTPQRDPLAPKPKTLLRNSPRVFSTDLQERGRETELHQAHPSQIATPSPEITRERRASVPTTPSDSETIATPSAGKRSSSHPYDGTLLAPAPIISPANSSHSTTYHASPNHHAKHTSSSYTFSHNMSVLVSEHNLRNTAQGQDTHDLADPFIAIDGRGRNENQSRERYPSPPRNQHHCSTHDNNSPLLRVRAASRGENAISRLVMSPSEASEAPSFGSPIKAEVEDAEYDITMRTPRPIVLERATQALTSPRTPPPPVPARRTDSAPHTPPLEQSVFRTPPRIAGGEMERIRQRQANLIDSRTFESEKRRPDYLVRAKRSRDVPDNDDAEQERESALPGLGVTISPMKGRRIKLYRPVPVVGEPASVEDFQRPDGADPKTPPPPSSVSTMSLRAINWRTPQQKRTPPVIWSEDDELKKQRRLAAFTSPKSSRSARRLKPVDVPGQGRMVMDVTSEETRALAEAGALEMPPPDSPDGSEVAFANGHGAGWPDSEYPWSLQVQQRQKEEEAEKRKRLHWIERFLDRESESEDDEQELAAAGPSTPSPPDDISMPSRTRQGRGKSISLRATPGSQRPPIKDRRVFGAANSDAREVLLSRKHVREVAERIRRRKIAEEEEGVVMCICQGADDGRPMVRCDECRTWYHLVCMDITDESELGDEWYCWKCVRTAEDPPPVPVFEPTFAPVMPDTPPRTSVGDLPLYQTALQPSPMLDIRARAPVSPVAPAYFSRDRDIERSPPRRSRLPHMLGDPDDPVRGGPSTPYHPRSTDSRLYSTPKFYDDFAGDEHLPFDPTSTPSRGLKFPNPVPITPRRLPAWTGQGLLWATPSGPPRTPQLSSQNPSSSARSLAYSVSTMDDSGGPLTSPWPSDDSPVRRPHKPAESTYPYPHLPPRRLLDSPLAVRGGGNRHFPPGIDESPTARYMPRGKDRDLGELTSHIAHGSPRRE